MMTTNIPTMTSNPKDSSGAEQAHNQLMDRMTVVRIQRSAAYQLENSAAMRLLRREAAIIQTTAAAATGTSAVQEAIRAADRVSAPRIEATAAVRAAAAVPRDSALEAIHAAADAAVPRNSALAAIHAAAQIATPYVSAAHNLVAAPYVSAVHTAIEAAARATEPFLGAAPAIIARISALEELHRIARRVREQQLRREKAECEYALTTAQEHNDEQAIKEFTRHRLNLPVGYWPYVVEVLAEGKWRGHVYAPLAYIKTSARYRRWADDDDRSSLFKEDKRRNRGRFLSLDDWSEDHDPFRQNEDPRGQYEARNELRLVDLTRDETELAFANRVLRISRTDLPEFLHCPEREVERRRKAVQRKRNKRIDRLRAEHAGRCPFPLEVDGGGFCTVCGFGC